MSKILIFLTILTALCFEANAQSQWDRVGPISFNSIAQISNSQTIICTDAGSVYQSLDFGKTWINALINPNRKFISMKFVNDKYGVIAADSGFVEKTTDGGLSWKEIYSGTTAAISTISYPSKDSIFCSLADGGCLRSIDAGNSWEVLTIPGGFNSYCMKFLNTKFGFIGSSSGILLMTTDGGNTWKSLQLPSTFDILSLDCNILGKIIVGTRAAEILISRDSGQHWDKSFSGNALADSVFRPISLVRFSGGGNIVAFESDGLYRLFSTNDGATWTSIKTILDTQVALVISREINFADAIFDSIGNGLVSGSFGTVYKIENFGLTGYFLHNCPFGLGIFPYDSYLVHMEVMPENHRYIHALSQRGPYCFSNDGGSTWTPRYAPNTGSHAGASYFDLHFINENTGILFSNTGKYSTYYEFQQTKDQFHSWQATTNSPRGNFAKSTIDPHGNIYIAGDSSIFCSSDDGNSWKLVSTFAIDDALFSDRKELSSTLYHIQAVADSNLFLSVLILDSIYSGTNFQNIFNYSSAIVMSTNLGKTWKTLYRFDLNTRVYDIKFTSLQLGFVNISVNKKGVISRKVLKTTDGGNSWTEVNGIFSNVSLGDISFSPSGKIGIIAGYQGDIYTSIDSGSLWQKEQVVYNLDKVQNIGFIHPYFLDDTTVIMTSLVGFWKKTFHTAQLSTTSSVVTSNPYLEIKLYPTPISHGTLHCSLHGLYSVERKAEISLLIFDILGRQALDISSIARSNSDGSTSIFDINVSSLSDGVYSLVLNTSNGGVSKKFVVTK